MTMVHNCGFMGDTIKLEHCLQQKMFPKRCFAIFAKKNQKFKMAVIFGKKFVKKYYYSNKISSFLCFAIFGKKFKKMNVVAIFGMTKFFSNIGFTTLQGYPMG